MMKNLGCLAHVSENNSNAAFTERVIYHYDIIVIHLMS